MQNAKYAVNDHFRMIRSLSIEFLKEAALIVNIRLSVCWNIKPLAQSAHFHFHSKCVENNRLSIFHSIISINRFQWKSFYCHKHISIDLFSYHKMFSLNVCAKHSANNFLSVVEMVSMPQIYRRWMKRICYNKLNGINSNECQIPRKFIFQLKQRNMSTA